MGQDPPDKLVQPVRKIRVAIVNATDKIRVAHLIGSLHIGGAENQATMLVNALDPQRFDRHVITLNESEQGFRGSLDSEVKYYCIHYRRRNAPFSLYRLYRYLKDHRIDVLHCHMYHAAEKGALIGRLVGIPVTLVHEHGQISWQRWWHCAIERKLISRWMTVRVAISEDIRRLRIERDGASAESIIVTRNAVDTTVPPSNNVNTPKKLGSLGRLVDDKDFVMLLRAVRVLVDQGYCVSLEIAGEGDERKALEQAISELELQEAVTLPGIRDANEFLSSIDLFVMSSINEGMPVALLEAMAHGLPIVATTAGGIPEIIVNGSEGLLSPPRQLEELAANIARMMDDQALRIRLGSAAREKVRSRYGIEKLAGEWEVLYQNLLQARGQKSFKPNWPEQGAK